MLNHKTAQNISNDPALEDLLNIAKSSQKKLLDFIANDDDEDRMGNGN